MSWIERLRTGLARTRAGLAGRWRDPGQLEELEASLLTADVGVAATAAIVNAVRSGADPATRVKAELCARLPQWVPRPVPDGPAVTLVVGVNGTGKTTTVARLAHRARSEGKRVVLAAADTFRAAAADQLAVWADRVGCELVRGREGSDPAAVAFDAARAAVARRADCLLVDTAGRLHTKHNLMAELAKIGRVLGRAIEGAPHDTLLVVDATTGQNAIQQARLFRDAVGLTGLILTKLDGTARGGVVVAIASELGLPVAFVGVGEGPDDLVPFDAMEFVAALVDG